MKPYVADLVRAFAIPIIAALGGAMAVFSEYDDAPGGVLLGLLLIMGAVALGFRAAQRRR